MTIYALKRHSLNKTTPTQENRLKTENNAPQIAWKNRARTDKGQVQTIRPETTEFLRPFPKSNTIEQIVKSGKNLHQILAKSKIEIADISCKVRGLFLKERENSTEKFF